MKTPSLAIADIYKLLETREVDKDVDVDDVIERFGDACKEFMRDAIGEEQDRAGKLRLSAIGKPARKLWQEYWNIRGAPLDGPTYIKFLMGHLTEAMVLSLVELAGHEVTEQQKQVDVEGVKGHIDCRIDGMLVDVKSASSFGFQKFKQNTLHKDDPFGYIAQMKCYAHQDNDTDVAWLAMDKSTGALSWLQYDLTDENAPHYSATNWDVVARVNEVKKLVEDSLPSKCFEPVSDGKSGNMKLQSGCVYCSFREVCWPTARKFSYSGGPRYLTEVVKTPRTLEVPAGF